MKKLFLIAALIMMAGTIYGQTLKKGNTLGLHVFTITLNSGVTMDQYLDFCKTKWIPVYEKNFRGVKVYVLKGIKGECLNCDGMILAWKTKADMERYYKPDGSATEIGNAANAKINPIYDELLKMVKMTDAKYTDWEVQ
jgi:hypothetical protein